MADHAVLRFRHRYRSTTQPPRYLRDKHSQMVHPVIGQCQTMTSPLCGPPSAYPSALPICCTSSSASSPSTVQKVTTVMLAAAVGGIVPREIDSVLMRAGDLTLPTMRGSPSCGWHSQRRTTTASIWLAREHFIKEASGVTFGLSSDPASPQRLSLTPATHCFPNCRPRSSTTLARRAIRVTAPGRAHLWPGVDQGVRDGFAELVQGLTSETSVGISCFAVAADVNASPVSTSWRPQATPRRDQHRFGLP
jgi:hypothetical protein